MQAPEAPPLTPCDLSDRPGLHEARIFVAEDDSEMRRLIQQTLELKSHLVTTTSSALELFDRLNYAQSVGIPVALIISDIRMPGLSGLDVLQHVRSLPLDAPVVLISAFCDEATLDEADRSGAAVVMSKPFELESLLTVIDFLLAGVSNSDA